MRIAQVCPYSLSVPGGVQNQVLGLARALRRLGHDTRVLAPCDGPPPDAGVIPLGRSIPLSTNGSVAPLAPDVPCALRTIRALRDEHFDVVHLQEPLAPGPTLTSLLFSDRPKVGTFHRAGDSAAYDLLKPAVRWVAKRLDVRCAVSGDARDTAAKALGGGPFEMMFNGVELERIAKADPWPSDGPTVFFVARHEPRKGLAVLLEAMADLPADVRLWVAGDGPETAALRAATIDDERIAWLGRISDAEVARRLRGATVFCAPSLHGESFGIVLLEAMAAGTAIVASDLPGYRKVARPDEDALLVPAGDVSALARALREAMSGGQAVEARIASGGLRAETFSMERLATRYLDIYDAAITDSRRQSR